MKVKSEDRTENEKKLLPHGVRFTKNNGLTQQNRNKNSKNLKWPAENKKRIHKALNSVLTVMKSIAFTARF